MDTDRLLTVGELAEVIGIKREVLRTQLKRGTYDDLIESDGLGTRQRRWLITASMALQAALLHKLWKYGLSVNQALQVADWAASALDDGATTIAVGIDARGDVKLTVALGAGDSVAIAPRDAANIDVMITANLDRECNRLGAILRRRVREIIYS